jgi:hypothetical protein
MEDAMKSNAPLLCPSYICKPGAALFGIVNANGFIDYLQSTIEIDETFVEAAQEGRTPEQRFRFAGKCAKNGCKQWNNAQHECGLIDTVIEALGNEPDETLQDCPIRPKCRWFAQKSELACANCNEIIRNLESKLLQAEL